MMIKLRKLKLFLSLKKNGQVLRYTENKLHNMEEI